jgi:hypothetical protein
MLVNHNINNLIGGVSTQPFEMRYDSQVDSMVNFMPDVTHGVRRRNGVEEFCDTEIGSQAKHLYTYERGDNNEEYTFCFSHDNILIYDKNGEKKTLTEEPIEAYNEITINDYHFDADGFTSTQDFINHIGNSISSVSDINLSASEVFFSNADENSHKRYYLCVMHDENLTLTHNNFWIKTEGGNVSSSALESQFTLIEDYITNFDLYIIDVDNAPAYSIYCDATMSYYHVLGGIDYTFSDTNIATCRTGYQSHGIPNVSYIPMTSNNETFTMTLDINGIVSTFDTAKESLADYYSVELQSFYPLEYIYKGTQLYDLPKCRKMITVGDTTFVANTEKIVRMKYTVSPTYRNNAFYWIKRSYDGDSGYSYYVNIGEDNYPAQAKSSTTAISTLESLINAVSLTKGYRATGKDSILMIEKREYFSQDETVSSTAYSSIKTEESSTYKYVRFRESANGSNYTDVDVTDTASQCLVCDYIEDGWYFETAEDTFIRLQDVTFDDQVGTNHISEVIPVLYRKSTGDASSASVDRVFQQVQNIDTSDFDISFGDSWGNQASIGWTDSVSKLTDLPADMSGWNPDKIGVVAISGTDKDEFTNYYVRWTGSAWRETLKEGIETTINQRYMPIKIVRQSDGNFIASFIEWDSRAIGDEDSNPIPSFIGNTISNIFFYKNRLCFTSEENVVMSETGEYYNFFSTTAMDILDSDMIDVAIDSDSVSIIRNVNTISGALTLWTDSGQFLLAGGEVLSPASTRIAQTSSYDVNNDIKPISYDNRIMFFNSNQESTEAYEYSPASIQSDNSTASSISAHCRGYLPDNIYSVAISSKHNICFILEHESNEIYCYRYFVNNNERIMSAWFKWTLGINYTYLSCMGDYLYMLTYTGKVHRVYIPCKSIDDTYLDFEGTENEASYESSIVCSEFNLQTNQNSRVIREPFYVKNIKINRQGDVDLDIINEERGSTRTTLSKHLDRKLLVGGHSQKVKVGFSTNYDTGCQINAISLEGNINLNRSRNM